jgi:hypothetical protein
MDTAGPRLDRWYAAAGDTQAKRALPPRAIDRLISAARPVPSRWAAE